MRMCICGYAVWRTGSARGTKGYEAGALWVVVVSPVECEIVKVGVDAYRAGILMVTGSLWRLPEEVAPPPPLVSSNTDSVSVTS